ncbi:MAG: hypothetical protein RL458_1237 [Pseudomonadota bacterium]|jgi:hypothetical protein
MTGGGQVTRTKQPPQTRGGSTRIHMTNRGGNTMP